MQIKPPTIPEGLKEISDIRDELRFSMEYETDFDSVRISRAHEEELSFGGVYIKNSTIENCRFINSDFSDCTFINVIVKGCDLSNCNFNNTYFKNCSIISSKLVGACFRNAVQLETAYDNCNAELTDYNGARFKNILISDCDFSSSLICSAELKNITLKNVKLVKATFFKTPLKDVNLTDCIIDGLVVSDNGAELRGATVDVYQAAMFAKLLGLNIE